MNQKQGPASPSDATVLARGFRQGRSHDVEAVRNRVKRIVAYRGYGIPDSDRADLVQEVLAQLWTTTRKPEFDEAGGFLGLVELVSTRRCIDWLRAQRRVVDLEDNLQDTRQGPLEQVLSAEGAALMTRALQELGEPCRQLIELHFRGRKSYREIAKRVGKSEGALRMQVFRCIRQVRTIVARLEDRPAIGLNRSQADAT